MSKEFVWTTDLLKEFGKYFVSTAGSWDKCVDSFIASHTPEIKRDWEIECIVHGNKNYWHRQDGLYGSDLLVGGSGKDWLLNNGGYIFQVTRKSDVVVFSVGDVVEYRSSDWDNDMWWGAKINRIELSKTSDKKLIFILDDNEEGNSITKFIENIRPFKLPERTNGCNICGGELILIRGRYPHSDKREVCPTCNTERLEQINEISGNNYGAAKGNKD